VQTKRKTKNSANELNQQVVKNDLSARGESGLRAILEERGTSRDVLLAFIAERLTTVSTLQDREHDLIDPVKQRQWWKVVSDQQKSAFTTPNPTRWRETATLYEDAILALSAGHLGRGRSLLEMAYHNETKVLEGMTALVSELNVPNIEATQLAQADPGAARDGCAPCDTPESLQTARKIQAVTAVASAPPNRGRPKRPAWSLALEEEEEEEGEDE
jgi:hypothetical protein